MMKNINTKISEIEKLLERIEDPQTEMEEAEKLVAKARAALDECYNFLKEEPKEE